ncbi:hypothetical protein GVAV_000169 [Gurleya vavrai]
MEIESFSKKEEEIKFHAAYDQQENDSEKIEQKIASEDEISSLKTNEQVKFQESYKEKQIENHDTDPSNFKGTEESIEKIDFQEHENKPEILDNDRKALESTPFNGNQYKNFNLYPNLGSRSQEALSVGVNFNYKNKLLSYDQSKICTNKKPIGSSELDDFNISSVSETEKEDYTEKSDFLENVSGTIIINEKNLLPKKILEDLDFKKTNIELNAKIDQDDIQDEKSENDKDENDQPLLEKKPGETYSSNLLDKKTDIAEQEQNTKVYLPALNSSNERKLSKKNSDTNKSDYNKKNSSAIVIANDEFVFYKDPIKHMINVDLLKSSEVEETKKSADTKIIDQSDEKPEKNNKMIKALKNVKIHGKGFFSNFSNVFNSKKNNSDKLSETKKTEPNVKNDAKIEILVNNEKTHEDEVIEVKIDEIAISKTKDDEFNTNKDISDNDLPEKLHETKTLNPDTENINSGSEKLEITAIEAPVSVSDENEYFLRELLSHNQKRLSERLSKGSIKSDQNNNNSIKNSKGKNLDLENVSLEENQPKDLTEKTKAVPISNDSNLNDDYFSAEVDNSFEKFENENKKNNQNEKPEDAISLETKGENFNGGFDNFNNDIFVQNNENNSSQDLESNFSIEIKNIAKKISKNYVEQDEKDLTIDKSNILKLEIDNEESSLLVNNDAIENKQETIQKSYPENFINPIIKTDENAIETKSISDIEKQIDLVFNNALSSHNEESKFSEESDYPGLIKPESFPITSNDSEELTVEPFNLAEKEQIKTTEFTGNKKNSQDLDIENDKSMIYTTVEPQNITSNSNKKKDKKFYSFLNEMINDETSEISDNHKTDKTTESFYDNEHNEEYKKDADINSISLDNAKNTDEIIFTINNEKSEQISNQSICADSISDLCEKEKIILMIDGSKNIIHANDSINLKTGSFSYQINELFDMNKNDIEKIIKFIFKELNEYFFYKKNEVKNYYQIGFIKNDSFKNFYETNDKFSFLFEKMIEKNEFDTDLVIKLKNEINFILNKFLNNIEQLMKNTEGKEMLEMEKYEFCLLFSLVFDKKFNYSNLDVSFAFPKKIRNEKYTIWFKPEKE